MQLLSVFIVASPSNAEKVQALKSAAKQRRHLDGARRWRISRSQDHKSKSEVRDSPAKPKLMIEITRDYLKTQHAHNAFVEGWKGQFTRHEKGQTLIADIETQKRFIAKLEGHLNSPKGRAKFWDVPYDHPSIQILGTIVPDSNGNVRIPAHFMSKRQESEMEHLFGDPAGSAEMQITNSVRTGTVFYDDQLPMHVKFPGDDFIHSTKVLTSAYARVSVENSLKLRKASYITPEHGAILISKANINLIFRGFPEPSTREIKRGDRLLSLSVLFSPSFRATEEAQSMFDRHGGEAAWFSTQLAPKISDVIYKSTFENFAHHVLHAQNIDVWMDSKGNVFEAKVKDLLDVMHDPVMELVHGTYPQYRKASQSEFYGDFGQSIVKLDKDFEFASYYKTWLGQLGGHMPENAAVLYSAIGQSLWKLIKADPGLYDMYTVSEKNQLETMLSGDLFNGLEKMRLSFIRQSLRIRFEPNKQAFENLKTTHTWSNTRKFATGFILALPLGLGFSGIRRAILKMAYSNIEFGYVLGVPTAITKNKNGDVREFFIQF